MDGFIFLIFLLFFVFPFLKRVNKSAKKPTRKYRHVSKNTGGWGEAGGQIRQPRQIQQHQNNGARSRLEYLAKEKNIRDKKNDAMTKVSNKSRMDWGARGESSMTSSKSIVIFLLLVLLAHFIIAAFAPDLIPGS